MKVSVIVVHYGADSLLVGCLESLRLQTFRDFEIIVVDNNKINRGFAGGCNEGIRQAKGEYIALLNNDARADREWLKELLESTVRYPSAMHGSLVLGPDGSIESAGCYVYPDGNGMCRGRGKKGDHWRYNARQEFQGFPSGCAAMYPRQLFDQIGLFDESFFCYNEDTDLGIRAQRAGYDFIYSPLSIVTHQGSKNTLKKLFYVERNRIKIMMKHFTFWQIVKSVPWTIYRYARGGR